jgi:hypothetical protein
MKTPKLKIEWADAAVMIQMCVQVVSSFNVKWVSTCTDNDFSQFSSLSMDIRGPVISNRPCNFFTNHYLPTVISYLRITGFLDFAHCPVF